jgi:hypothetical protein
MHSTSIFLDDSQFHLTAGKPKTYTTRHEYGMKFVLHFCDECSALLWKTADAEQFKGKVAVGLGTLDDADIMNKLKPEKELYVRMRTKWVLEMEGLDQGSNLDSAR